MDQRVAPSLERSGGGLKNAVDFGLEAAVAT